MSVQQRTNKNTIQHLTPQKKSYALALLPTANAQVIHLRDGEVVLYWKVLPADFKGKLTCPLVLGVSSVARRFHLDLEQSQQFIPTQLQAASIDQFHIPG